MCQGSPCGVRTFLRSGPFFLSLWWSRGLGCHVTLDPSDFPQGVQARTLHQGPTMQPGLPAQPPLGGSRCVSEPLLHWYLWLVTNSVGFPPPFGYGVLWDSKAPHWHTCEKVSYCMETSPFSGLPVQDGSLSVRPLSLFLSFIFRPISFWRDWAAFLSVWYPLPTFRSCFVEVARHSNDLLENVWGRKWSSCPIPPPSSDRSQPNTSSLKGPSYSESCCIFSCLATWSH